MKHKLFVISIFILISIACKNNRNNEDLKEPTIENINDHFANKDSINNGIDGSVFENNDNSNSKLVNNPKLQEKKEKLIDKKKEVIADKIDQSKLKDKNCDQIIAKYKEVLKEFERTKNIKLLKWKDNNDPIYQYCLENHKKVFDSLERVENAIGLKLGL